MPTIKKPNQHFDATLYTGTGSAQTITNAGGFQPDFVWMKGRSNVRNNNLYDSVRGTTKELNSNTTGAETTNATGLTAFNSNGWTIGSDGGINTSSETYVGWQWKAGGASTVNTSGTISSNVSVNATAGFSIVTYTNSSGRNAHTVGHGLGVAPKMFIIKTRSATADWPVYHTSLGATKAVYLNSTLNEQTSATFFNNTTPSSSVITLGSGLSDAGVTIVAYCWAEVEGYSKFGSYTGNGVNGNGPFVYCGFRPKFVMFKNTNTTQNWIVMDTARDTKNKMTQWLSPNTSGAEYTDANIDVDFLSNGFKIRTSIGTELNGNGNAIIFAAFAEAPFKFSNAR